MTSKPSLTPTPVGPALVKRIVPVVAAASMITGCLGDPGDPGNDAAFVVFDAGRSPRDAYLEVRDAGIAAPPTDAAFRVSEDDAAVADDAGSVDAGAVSGDDAD
ncbi:MAG: hypothetical protein J0L92_11600 [Deltaproteobacteria bacterium]|nr:hypothetical protein [Deltaproteobacteria bacterium]